MIGRPTCLDLPHDRPEPGDEGQSAQQAAGRYRRTLALAGTMHGDRIAVSSDKAKVLDELYADEHVAR